MTRRTIYTGHGFRVSDEGNNTTDRLGPYIEAGGWHHQEIDPGYMHRVRVRLCNDRLARIIAAMAKPGSIAIGHSNFCSVIHMATEYGAPFDQVVYINPALDSDAAPGKQVSRFHVWHTPGDFWTKAARFIPGSTWGNMGAKGYTGNDRRGINYNMADLDRFIFSVNSHSGVFSETAIRYFGPKIIKALGAP